MMHTLRRSAVITAILTVAIPASAHAAVTLLGIMQAAIAAPSRGNAAAYDPINHVFLVVSANGGVYGRFEDRNGTPLGAPFLIQANGALFGAFPRATYARDANGGTGGFLVNWTESDPAGPTLHGRMVAFGAGGAYGADNATAMDNTWWEEAAYGAYSTANHEFLVVYRNTAFVLRGIRFDINATPLGLPFTISQTGQYENNPSVAYNPSNNQFLVCWQMFTAANTGLLDCRFVLPGSGALGAGPIQVQATGSVWFTDTTYNPSTNQFLVTWDEAHGSATLGRLVNADGSLPGNVIGISNRYAGYDTTATAYNPITHSFFVIAYDLVGDLTQDGGVELDEGGQPKDLGQEITAICLPGLKCANYYPQIAASSDDPTWLVTTATSFAQTSTQLISGTASGPPPPPPPPTPRPMVYVDSPSTNATVSARGFSISGWAADLGATSGTGVDAVMAWAYPAGGGAPIVAGVASYGLARPDVGTALGSPQLTQSGYVLPNVQLPVGQWTLAVYAHSLVNNSWNSPFVLNVTVVQPPSTPLMSVDYPAANQTVSQFVRIAGWAVDLGALSGSGVDAIHVWAFPAAGSPVFIGATTTGGSRSDIGAWLGPQFATSGFDFTAQVPPGVWTLVVFAHSAVTGTFNNMQTVLVTVR